MRFMKMQGTGNDYIYINCFEEPFPENPEALALRLSDRHFSIGSDGLIFICPSDIADIKMLMYNADGSNSPMCGNGIRCVGKYAYDMGLTKKEKITVETPAGLKHLSLNIAGGVVKTVTVNMGRPILRPADIPVLSSGEAFVNQPVTVDGAVWKGTAVSVGNPHFVIFLPDISALDLETIGPKFENHPTFPHRINTEFAAVIDKTTINMRVWERGAGETLSCGTGACATLVAAVLNGLTDRCVDLNVAGGALKIHWDEDTGNIYMTGGAEFSFSGEIPV
ncbi:MAG: diaminopimelate epimerase [Clostridiales bacterium]|nr:diaminopimelate epimerase [Clostridiales bacterium]